MGVAAWRDAPQSAGGSVDWWSKTLLATLSALAVLEIGRRCGHRAAGLVAALPTTTAPTLAWLVFDKGTPFAVTTAIGSVAACGMLAAFAFAYGSAARRGGPVRALVIALLAAAALAFPALSASRDLAFALALALGSGALALAVWPADRGTAADSRRRIGSTLPTALAIGTLTALAATLGPRHGGFVAGLLASLPLVSGPIAMVEHAQRGHRAASVFLRAYVWGLYGKAAFGAVFALLAAPLGSVPALLLAIASAVLVTLLRPSVIGVVIQTPQH